MTEGIVSRTMRKAMLAGCASALLIGVAKAEDVSLNGTWLFAHAPDEARAQRLAGFYKPEFKPEGFEALAVPSNWALHGFEQPTYKRFKDDMAPEGFYLRRFRVPAAWAARRVLLRFGGVWASAEVWLNGKELGRHDSGFTEFAFDVTRHLKPNDENVLAVRVRQAHVDYALDANDDWALGGIYRDVTLEAMPKERWLDTVSVRTDFDDHYQDADLAVRVMVGDHHKKTLPGNYVSPGAPYTLRLTLLDMAGRTVQEHQVEVEGHSDTNRETMATLRVRRPHHWTAETPHLYTLRVQLLEAGKVAHERFEKVGFREISWSGGVFRINGQAVKLRGVNRHEEHPDVGRATTRAHWIEDIRLMKEANINFVRLAHYPSAKGFIELCDEMGMYVGNEIAMGYEGDNANDPALAAGVMLRSYATVARDINRPSVIYWSVGNEDPLTTNHMAAVRAVKGWDPTRPVLLPWRAEHWLPPEIDIMAPHYWKAQENSDFAARSSRPVITTEFTHAYGEDGFGGLNERWRALIQHPAGAGGAIWMWADQGLKFNVRKEDGKLEGSLKVIPDGWDGIVDSYRKPTRDYWETKAVYAQVYPLRSSVTFLPGQASVPVPIQNEFDFTNLKDVAIEWSVMEDERRLEAGKASIAGEPHAAATFDLPLKSIQTVRPGSTYYAWFRFLRPDGSEITRRTVELVNVGNVPAVAVPAAPVRVEQGPLVRITSADARFDFDPKSGHLVAASRAGTPVLGEMRPALWRKLNPNETGLVPSALRADLADLSRAQGSASNWAVREVDGAVTIAAKVEYTVNTANRYTVDYSYVVKPGGALQVSYVVRAAVVAPWLPFVGVTLKPVPELTQFRWLGLGPLDAFPNENTAPILGVWSGVLGTPDVTGVKATRWAEFTAQGRGGFRVRHEGYVDTATGSEGGIRVLSAVVGRGSKGRRPEGAAAQLNTAGGQSFAGAFTLELLP